MISCAVCWVPEEARFELNCQVSTVMRILGRRRQSGGGPRAMTVCIQMQLLTAPSMSFTPTLDGPRVSPVNLGWRAGRRIILHSAGETYGVSAA